MQTNEYSPPGGALPLFLVGWRRTGTTWLGSLLAKHPQIAAVTGGRPGQTGGIVENGFFHYLDRQFDPLDNPNQLIRLLLIWTNSTFFRLSGLQADMLFKARPSSYAQIFKLTMDNLARQQMAKYWLDKCPAHSLYPKRILHCFPQAKFIAIQRDIEAQVVSALRLTEKITRHSLGPAGKIMFICREVLAYHLAYAAISEFARLHPQRICQVRYHELVQDRLSCLQKICTFLEIEPVPGMENSPFRPGSSFLGKESEREQILSPGHRVMLHALHLVCRSLPGRIFLPLIWVRKNIFSPKLPFWFFSSIIEEYQWADIFGSGRTRDL